MPNQKSLSIWRPWWVLAESDDNECLRDACQKCLRRAWQTLWLERLQQLQGPMLETQLAWLMGWEYIDLYRMKTGRIFARNGPPIIVLYQLAAALHADVRELLPTSREFYTAATKAVIERANQIPHPATFVDVPHTAAMAYVEYHLWKSPELYDVLDGEAVGRAFESLSTVGNILTGTTVDWLAQLIDRAADSIDQFLSHSGGRSDGVDR